MAFGARWTFATAHPQLRRPYMAATWSWASRCSGFGGVCGFSWHLAVAWREFRCVLWQSRGQGRCELA